MVETLSRELLHSWKSVLQLSFLLIDNDENVVGVGHHLKDLLSFGFGKCLLVCKFSFHMISSEISTVDDTLPINDKPFALSSVVRPFAVVDLLLLGVEHPALAVTLSIDVCAVVNVSGSTVMHQSLQVLTLVDPTALVCGPIDIYDLALTILHVALVLSVVNVTIRVKQLADT